MLKGICSGSALAILVSVPIPAWAGDSIASQSVIQADRVSLIYLDASCSDNPECEVARLECDVTGLGMQLVAVGALDLSNLLTDGSGARLKAGNQSARLMPTEMMVDELAGDGWIVKFGAWMSNSEENSELIDELLNSPIQLVDVSRSMALALPTGRASLQEQRAFAKVCQKLRR